MLGSKDISYPKNPNIKHLQILDLAKNLNMVMDVSMKDSSDPQSQPYVSSPLTLPPYDSLSPTPLPDNSPPFCVYPPPQSSSTSVPNPYGSSPTPPSPSFSSPNEPTLIPPSGPFETTPPPFSIIGPPTTLPGPPVENPPYYEPSPPSGGGGGGYVPSPPEYVPSPVGFAPTAPVFQPPVVFPPESVPSPPEYVPSPVGFAPAPPVFQPPVVYPHPLTPPTTGGGGGGGGGQRVWCVAKPSVPDPILQEAMNYACASGADCGPIQPNGQCFQPNSILAHASYAFNSYWQRTKVAGGTCSFGGIAMLVTVDPSSQGCHFLSN